MRIMFLLLVGLSPYFSILLGNMENSILKRVRIHAVVILFASVVKEFPLRRGWYN